MIAYSWFIIITYKSVSAIFILPTNSEVVAIITIAFSSILIDLVFPILTIIIVVIILRGEVSSTYKYW